MKRIAGRHAQTTAALHRTDSPLASGYHIVYIVSSFHVPPKILENISSST